MHKEEKDKRTTQVEDVSEKLKEGFAKARGKLIEQEKADNGYLVVSDKQGNIKRYLPKT